MYILSAWKGVTEPNKTLNVKNVFDTYRKRKLLTSIHVLDTIFKVKSLEQAQDEESSDSSEDEGDDDEEEEPEPVKKEPENNNVFKFPPTAPKGMSNGHPRSRHATLRKTKQKGYWQNFLSGLLEK